MSVFVFAIIHLAPGDPVQAALGLSYSARAAAILRHQMGLDRPIVVQYLTWLGLAVRGDLGRSIRTGIEVRDEIVRRLPITLELALLALLVARLAIFVTVLAFNVVGDGLHDALDPKQY